jgi:hypothetical protein
MYPQSSGVPASVRYARRRPTTIVVAVVAMVPAFAVWLVGGIAFFVASVRSKGDAAFLGWILATVVLALCLLVAVLTVVGIRDAWVGRSARLKVPAIFTTMLFVFQLIHFFVAERPTFQLNMLVPLVVGVLAMASWVLMGGRSATAWVSRHPA